MFNYGVSFLPIGWLILFLLVSILVDAQMVMMN
jgi:hypothetical protein